jgi:hypothetical protein
MPLDSSSPPDVVDRASTSSPSDYSPSPRALFARKPKRPARPHVSHTSRAFERVDPRARERERTSSSANERLSSLDRIDRTHRSNRSFDSFPSRTRRRRSRARDVPRFHRAPVRRRRPRARGLSRFLGRGPRFRRRRRRHDDVLVARSPAIRFGFECTPRASSRAPPRARENADDDDRDARVLARATNESLSTRARGGASTNESRHFSDLESFPLARARDARKTRGRRGNVRERVSHRARSRARDEGARASARVGEG